MDDISFQSLLLRAGALVILIAANAFFVAAEFALVASRPTRLHTMAQSGDAKAKLARSVVQSIDRYISGTQLGITVASLGLGWIGEPAVASVVQRAFQILPAPADVIATHAVATAIAFLFITFLHIVLGELAPKTVALIHPEATSRWVAGPLILFTKATNPFIWVLNGSANALLRLFGMRAPSEVDRVHRPEEIVLLLRQTQRSGQLDEEDVEMIEGVFEFTEKHAKDVMTPRTEIEALPAGMTVSDAATRVGEIGRSRYPVYQESPDDIVGIVHIKQILKALREHPEDPITSLMRPPFFVPGTREVEDVLTDFKRLKTQMAVVLDEYGGTAGVVTMEDLLEEIVGEIYDEYDEAEPQPQPAIDGVVLPGDMEIDDVNEQYGLELEGGDYQTIGGFVFGQLGRLPGPGDRVQLDTVRFEVVEMDGRRVGKLKMTKQQTA